MATYVNNFRTGYKLECEVTTKSQNVAQNTSVVTVKVYLTSTGSSYKINSSVQKGGTILINGIDYGFYCYVSLSGNQRKLLHEADFTIAHNSDGSKSFSVSATVNLAVTLSGTYWGNVTASGTYTPARISRASSFSLNVSTATFGSTSITVNISRESSSLTHKVYYQIQNSNHNAWLINGNSSVGTSISFTPGVSDCQYLPNSVSGTAIIKVDTYSGSTWIGSDSKTITVKVPDSAVPTISNHTVTETGSGIGQYIKGKSKVQISYSCSAGQGASISSKTTTITGLSSNSNTSFTSGIFTSTGSKTITTTVKDSRGRTATKSVTINVIDYNPPAFTIKAERCTSDGTIDEFTGTHFKITTAVTSYSDLSNSNTLTWEVYSYTNSPGVEGWYLEQSGSGLKSSGYVIAGGGRATPDNRHEAKIVVKDEYGTYERKVDIPTAYVTMDFLQGGKGIAFGKVASLNDTFECNMFGQFNRAVKTTRGTWCHQAGGKGGENGYIKFCTLTVTDTYKDSPMTIMVARRRDHLPKELIISFNNSDTKDPTLKAFYVRGTTGNFYIHKSSTSTWDLYALKNESYDNVGIMDIKMSKYQIDGISVTWHDGVQVSDLPSGYITATPYNSFLKPEKGSWFNDGTPVVGTDGVMEVGKYIDFHLTSTSTDDYDARLRVGSKENIHCETNLLPGANNTRNLGNTSFRWQWLNLTNQPNVSSDRTLKENITYVKSEKAKSVPTDEIVTYEDMYDFVKNDLELATYNFKGQEEQNMNFIAQDLLYNLDGTDNKVGQMIINPIATPTEEEIEEAKTMLEEGQEYEYPTLSYDMGMYISVLAGALKTALNKIDSLEEQLSLLQENIIKGEE